MNEKLSRIPLSLFLIMYLGYVGYQFYEFHYSTDGTIESHRGRLTSLQNDVQALKKKLEVGKKFIESLEAKKIVIQQQVRQLEEFKVSFSENLDVPAILKMLIFEAKRTGIRIDRLEPGQKSTKKYYQEQEFKVDFSGTYSQMVHYFQRIAQLQKILRVEGFTMKPQATANPRGNFLNGKISIRAYQYVVSSEDQVAKGVKK